MCFSGIGQIIFGIIMVACFVLTCASIFSPSWGEFKDDAEKTIHSGIFSFNCHRPGSDSTTDDCDWDKMKTWEKVTVVAMCLALATELLCLAWNLFACFACCCKKYVIHPLTMFATLVAIFLAVGVIVYGVNNKDALNCALKNIESLFDNEKELNFGENFNKKFKDFGECFAKINGYEEIKKIVDSKNPFEEIKKLVAKTVFEEDVNGTDRSTILVKNFKVTIVNGTIIEDINWSGKAPPSSEVGYSFWMAAAALVLAVVDIVVAALAVCLAEKCC